VIGAIRADNWLRWHGDIDSPLGREIKQRIKAAFYGEDTVWKQDVWERAADVCRKGLRGLAAG
jgi:hypothetical protein